MSLYIGVCLGATTISLCKRHNKQIEYKRYTHGGNPKGYIKKILKDNKNAKIVVTGRKFRKQTEFPSISEPEAVEYGYRFLKKKYPDINAILSTGGETFLLYLLDSNGRIIAVHTGNKCASGTGEFFLQQLKRMNLSIEEAMEIAKGQKPYNVAQRCSVFCKSDCTHALNKGVAKGQVVAGLCQMMANKGIELISKVKAEKIMVIGGVTQNELVMEYLAAQFPEIIIPDEALFFEALGASLWLEENTDIHWEPLDNKLQSSFDFLKPLYHYEDMVEFHTIDAAEPSPGDTAIIGLDVGSTTTKAVLMREKDCAILGKVYLRTNGDPVGASRRCYNELGKQVNINLDIIGLGVTGSGRYIAGIHGKTKGVINEIIAHSTAAIYFDPMVDTIFEIGGQDAKYTYITGGLPTDYAMNEACAAGTGSFLEESCKESLDIDTVEIGSIAMNGTKPPNFNDQCSAFISSDIKTAIQEGIPVPDIVAGLVYSICMNYNNRVKGSRKVGDRIFMQGGVCYNPSVPLAMAALTGKKIIVPPEPGLMGAFGVALEVKKRISQGIIQKGKFDLKTLASREVDYGNSFICNGGLEKCDRKCTINTIIIDGNKYPFGGACNKYYNLQGDKKHNKDDNYIRHRERLIFKKYLYGQTGDFKGTVGINRSLLTNTFYPLYHNFFTYLGYKVVLSKEPLEKGLEKKGSSFCYPVELSHGFFESLISQKPDFIFVPHIRSLYVEKGYRVSAVCPTVQAEPYILKTAFLDSLSGIEILGPVLDFQNGYQEGLAGFLKISNQLKVSQKAIKEAYGYSLEIFLKAQEEMKSKGREIIDNLKDDEKLIVLFGRPYNAFTEFANMGIPDKFASRGYKIIPLDYLPLENEKTPGKMYWGSGQQILKGAKMVSGDSRLFGVFITNFSCGPDSFLLNYFRNIMGDKPSLTLELDSHTADAGIDTRVEAFLDIIKSFSQKEAALSLDIMPEETEGHLIRLDGKKISIHHPGVKLLIPSMGDMGSKALAGAFQSEGVKAEALPIPSHKELLTGKSLTTCKECLPMILTTGALMEFLKKDENKTETIVYFMPETDGPCRFGQYNRLMKNILVNKGYKNVAFLSLSSDNGYGGMGVSFFRKALIATIISDIMDDIYSGVITLSWDIAKGMAIYKEVEEELLDAIRTKTIGEIINVCNICKNKLNEIPLRCSIGDVPAIGLTGEIYVRKDPFSRQDLVERFAKEGIVVKVAPILEWIYYTDYLVVNGLTRQDSIINRAKSMAKLKIMAYYENKIKSIFAQTGIYQHHPIKIEEIVKEGSRFINPKLTGEAILTVGSTVHDIGSELSGVIALGPFGCMPNRIAEAILNYSLESYLPFLTIETDGNPFPQIIEARLESFILQVNNFYRKQNKAWRGSSNNI